jgi:hypothetical protein
MADPVHESTKSLPVRGVYEFFKALEMAKDQNGSSALETFLAECDQKDLRLGVGDVLYEVGHLHFSGLVRINAVGPDCPACPDAPRL